MRTIAIEEHWSQPDLIARIGRDAIVARGWPAPDAMPPGASLGAALGDVGEGRIDEMDAAGLDVSVLSVGGPGADLLPPEAGVALARDTNDRLASLVRKRSDRFAGFAHLPMTAPEAAAEELERCVRALGFVGAMVNGLTAGRFLDDRRFEPILARAEALAVPLYLHPGIAPAAVREAYFEGLPGQTGFLLAGPGFGWHAETAIHVLRLVLSGALDRHPRLKLIVGHMGETLPTWLTRFDDVLSGAAKHLHRRVSETLLDQLHITTSAWFDTPAFLAAFTAFGAERILFSVDYPFSDMARGVNWLRSLPVTPAELERIAHGNAERLLRLPES